MDIIVKIGDTKQVYSDVQNFKISIIGYETIVTFDYWNEDLQQVEIASYILTEGYSIEMVEQ